ncbi:hypothetical protein QJS10_CPB17g00643 [Acorus calamus]|uniref:Uncharacterized protein n=1 Tax=Acorus calamus TaxID=4465 RepID=A0AAV9CUY3_ACOCL|nr:hypothetical protein QJS10_CPB17g00643 [Acorus calamus]
MCVDKGRIYVLKETKSRSACEDQISLTSKGQQQQLPEAAVVTGGQRWICFCPSVWQPCSVEEMM